MNDTNSKRNKRILSSNLVDGGLTYFSNKMFKADKPTQYFSNKTRQRKN